MTKAAARSSVLPEEIAHFSKDSAKWWDESGPFAPLHRITPVRMRFLIDALCRHFDRDPAMDSPLSGLRILDIGCGGGLVCEPLSRLGATVTGIDADATALQAARAHAEDQGLAIAYDQASAEQRLSDGGSYDAVIALEIVEHVNEMSSFVQTCCELTRPGGLLVMSTLNRTPKSFLLGKVAAEYVLGWVPRGTHHWRKFVRPSELSRALRQAGALPLSEKGIVFRPLLNSFDLSDDDLDVNYILAALRQR